MSRSPSRPTATINEGDCCASNASKADKIINSMMSMQIRHGFARQILHDHVQLGDPHRGHGELKPRVGLRDPRQVNLEQ